MSAPTAAPEAERRRGYGRWTGERGAQRARWWVIARGNLQLALANRWVKLVLIVSMIPGVIVSGITYFFIPLSPIVLATLMSGMAVFAFLIGALVGARLISEDRRQGAFLAHFSRPVTQRDYVLGKFIALLIPMLLVTMASPLFAVLADAAVDNETLVDRLRRQNGGAEIPDPDGYLLEAGTPAALGAVLWFGLTVSFATSGIVLGLSAMTTRTRNAGVAWFAVVVLGFAAYGILADIDADWPALLSWVDAVRAIPHFLMGLDEGEPFNLTTRVLVLAAAGAAGLVVVHRQLQRAEGGAR